MNSDLPYNMPEKKKSRMRMKLKKNTSVATSDSYMYSEYIRKSQTRVGLGKNSSKIAEPPNFASLI